MRWSVLEKNSSRSSAFVSAAQSPAGHWEAQVAFGKNQPPAAPEAWRGLRTSLLPPTRRPQQVCLQPRTTGQQVSLCPRGQHVGEGSRTGCCQGLIYKASFLILPHTGLTSKTNSLIWAFIIAPASAYFCDGQCRQNCNFLLLTKRKKNKYTLRGNSKG